MIYLDASAVLAHLLAEHRRPPDSFWARGSLTSSQLLTFEVHVALHRMERWNDQGHHAQSVLDQLTIIPLTDEALDRARQPFPIPLRTLDALHLASASFLRAQGEFVSIATYDQHLAAAARSLGFALEPL